MVATRSPTVAHRQSLAIASRLLDWHRDMYQPGAIRVTPKKLLRLFADARVRFVLMGTHGIGGYRLKARATQDIDLLVHAKDYEKATEIVRRAYPKLAMDQGLVVTRFIDPATQEAAVDLMKPVQPLYQAAFKHSVRVEEGYRIPSLELALACKFAAMISPFRETEKRHLDAGDFISMVKKNHDLINRHRLKKLADLVYRGGGTEVVKMIENVMAGRPVSI